MLSEVVSGPGIYKCNGRISMPTDFTAPLCDLIYCSTDLTLVAPLVHTQHKGQEPTVGHPGSRDRFTSVPSAAVKGGTLVAGGSLIE